jgi:hypothetical protein
MKVKRLVLGLCLATVTVATASAQETTPTKPKETPHPEKAASAPNAPNASFGNFDYWVYPVKYVSPRKLAEMLKRLPLLASVTVDDKNQTLTITGVRGFSDLKSIRSTLEQLDREDTTPRSVEMRTYFIAAGPAPTDEKLPSALNAVGDSIRATSGASGLHLIASTVSRFASGSQSQFRTSGTAEQTVGGLKGFFEYQIDVTSARLRTDQAGKEGLALGQYQIMINAPVPTRDRSNEPSLEMKRGAIQSGSFLRFDEPVILGSVVLGDRSVFVVVTLNIQN